MSTYYCAACREPVPADNDHIRIAAESINMDSRDKQDDYMLHIDCWEEVSDDWMTPA